MKDSVNLPIDNILNKPYECDAFKIFRDTLELVFHKSTNCKLVIDEQKFKDCFYINIRAFGLSLCYTGDNLNNYLSAVHVMRHKPNYSQCPLSLPLGLDCNMKIKDVVAKFGQPDKKSGGGFIPVCITYLKLKPQIEIEFVSGNWSDPTNQIKKIADVLRDETQSVEERIHHLFSAKHIGGEEAVKAVLPLLSNSSALLAHEAAYVLGQIQHESAVPYLTETLRNTSLDCMVRHEAAEALAAIGLPESIQVVKEYLNDQTKCVRETCYLALRSLEDKASGEALKYASSVYKTVDPVSTIKKNLSDNQSTESLREILLDEKEDLYKRYYALFQLRDRKAENQAQLAIMESLTKDKSSELFRHEVAFVLGQLQLLKSLKPLFECLSNTQEHPMARHEAAIAIGSVVIGNMSSTSCCQKAIEKLEEFSSDSTQVVAESCLVALDNINREKNLIEAY